MAQLAAGRIDIFRGVIILRQPARIARPLHERKGGRAFDSIKSTTQRGDAFFEPRQIGRGQGVGRKRFLRGHVTARFAGITPAIHFDSQNMIVVYSAFDK